MAASTTVRPTGPRVQGTVLHRAWVLGVQGVAPCKAWVSRPCDSVGPAGPVTHSLELTQRHTKPYDLTAQFCFAALGFAGTSCCGQWSGPGCR
jgi:hypothetical protein